MSINTTYLDTCTKNYILLFRKGFCALGLRLELGLGLGLRLELVLRLQLLEIRLNTFRSSVLDPSTTWPVVRALACEAGRLGLILSWVIPKTLKMVSAASLALTLSN